MGGDHEQPRRLLDERAEAGNTGGDQHDVGEHAHEHHCGDVFPPQPLPQHERVLGSDRNNQREPKAEPGDDDGNGIPAASRDQVFERFTRLDEARMRDGGGSGLGLAIVREVAEAHGGTATATNSPIGGARIELRLPLIDS